PGQGVRSIIVDHHLLTCWAILALAIGRMFAGWFTTWTWSASPRATSRPSRLTVSFECRPLSPSIDGLLIDTRIGSGRLGVYTFLSSACLTTFHSTFVLCPRCSLPAQPERPGGLCGLQVGRAATSVRFVDADELTQPTPSDTTPFPDFHSGNPPTFI